MCKKQQYLQLYKISTRVFVFYTIPPVCRKRRPPSKSLGNDWKLLSTTSRHLRSVRNNTAPDDFQLYKISTRVFVFCPPRDPPFAWSTEPREGPAACRAKEVPSFLSYFKTLSIGAAPGIEPATSRSAVKRSTD